MNHLQQYDLDRLQSCTQLVGVDEAGRGCLAGPVVATACVITAELFESKAAVMLSSRINDSKQLSAEAREAQFAILEQLQADGFISFAVAEASVDEIAIHNILGATRLAMQRSLEEVASRKKFLSLPHSTAADSLFQDSEEVKLIVDGRPLKPFPYAHEGVVKGDGKSISIAMASIAAKVSRDHTMASLDNEFPEYGFAQHKGYGTLSHRAALQKYGATPIHRELFLRKVL
ncbi:ribonuclease HII [Puniceicoccaceae bacterium]|nr:ribonuclease HII [Puniceicoccaceae bacterium]